MYMYRGDRRLCYLKNKTHVHTHTHKHTHTQTHTHTHTHAHTHTHTHTHTQKVHGTGHSPRGSGHSGEVFAVCVRDVCVCAWERGWGEGRGFSVWERHVCVCVWERERARARECLKLCFCVCACGVCLCVCVCERERARARERDFLKLFSNNKFHEIFFHNKKNKSCVFFNQWSYSLKTSSHYLSDLKEQKRP